MRFESYSISEICFGDFKINHLKYKFQFDTRTFTLFKLIKVFVTSVNVISNS